MNLADELDEELQNLRRVDRSSYWRMMRKIPDLEDIQAVIEHVDACRALVSQSIDDVEDVDLLSDHGLTALAISTLRHPALRAYAKCIMMARKHRRQYNLELALDWDKRAMDIYARLPPNLQWRPTSTLAILGAYPSMGAAENEAEEHQVRQGQD